MAKRESKKSVSLTNPGPNADVAGPSSVNYNTKKRSKMKWFMAAPLLLLMIFIGGAPLFLDTFPIMRQFLPVEFLNQSFAFEDREGDTNLTDSEKKMENEEENNGSSNKVLTVSNTNEDAKLRAQLERLSNKFYSLQQRVQKLEKDQKDFDARVSSQRLKRLSTDESQIKLSAPSEAANPDQSILIMIQEVNSELNDLKAQLQDKKLFFEGNKRDMSTLRGKKPISKTGAAIVETTPKLLQISVGQLANSMASGQDFSFQLDLIEQLVGDKSKVAAIVKELRPIALRGVKSKSFLKKDFIEKIERISIPTQEKETIFGELKHQLKSLVKIKKVSGIALDTDEAILVDAHDAVKKFNFKLASEKISSLPNSVRMQINDWLMIVKDRVDAYRLLAKLKQLTLAAPRQKNN
mgnify:CR=1 FL=1